MGGPRSHVSLDPTLRLSVSLPISIHAELDRHKQERGESRSRLVSRLLTAYFELNKRLSQIDVGGV